MGFKDNLHNFLGVLRHPIVSYRRSIDYDNVVSSRNGFRIAKKGLETDKKVLEEQNLELVGRAGNLGNALAQIKTNYTALRQKIPEIEKLVRDTIEICSDARTGMDVIMARTDANRPATNALQEWQKAYVAPLEKRLQEAEAEAAFLKKNSYGLSADIAMEKVVHLDPRIQKIPFVFYNMVTEKLTHTPATLEFFGVNEKATENMSLGKLLRKVAPEYLKGEKGILAALKHGEKLSHRDAETRGENPINLKLTTYPVKYDDKILGVGILLYDPKVSLRLKKDRTFIEDLDKILHETAEELSQGFAKIARLRELGFA